MDKIKVAIRLRPFNKREIALGAKNSVAINDNQVTLRNCSTKEKSSPKSFTFDACFDSSSEDKPNYSTQQKIYEVLGKEILESSMAGYNGCIFAYGQTGSGKSFTMMGTENNKGLIPRLCEDIFNEINEKTTSNHSFKVEVSYIEIYNEKVRDLLDPSGSKLNLKVREHQLLGPYVDGLSHLAVSSYPDIISILNEGNKSRTVAATNMNAESSRSHAVFCIKVSQTIVDEQSQVTHSLIVSKSTTIVFILFVSVIKIEGNSSISGEKVSRISLVDLAGSEKVSKTGVEGDRLREGCNINKSLHTLGQVISALADSSSKTKQKHIPYRDSVLTWLLKDSIGGNSKTVMISAISPSMDNYEETLSTLRYADRAKKIVNNPVVNEDPNAKIIRNLREEVENLRKELEKAKEQNSEFINDRLQQSEKLYKEISKPWNEKLAETEKIQQEWDTVLESMGISVQSSGIKVEKDKYYLVNLNPDPSLNELLVYYLKDITLVGRADAENKQDIQLMGPGIAEQHCAFYFKNNHVCIGPIKEAKTWVNGKVIERETVLHHGDRIVLGINHYFRLNCPTASGIDRMNRSELDFNRAQEEVLFRNKNLQSSSWIENESNIDDDKSNSSIFSSNYEDNLELELAIQKLEQEYSNTNFNNSNSNHISSSSSSSSINRSFGLADSKSKTNNSFKKGLDSLRNQLLRANSLCREANSLCKEMNKMLRFSVTLEIPAHNLTPNRKPDALLCEPAIVVKNKSQALVDGEKPNKIVIDLEKFSIYIYELRESYSERTGQSICSKDSDLDPRTPDIFTKSDSYYHNLIGVANLFLDVIYQDLPIPFEYDLPVIDQQGQLAARLRVSIEQLRLDSDSATNSEDSESLQSEANDKDSDSVASRRHFIKIRFAILSVHDLALHLNNLVFCDYQFWDQKAVIVPSVSSNEKSSTVNFNHTNEFTVETTEEFMDYCQDKALSIKLMAHRHKLDVNQSSIKNDLELNQYVKYQCLIDSWSEVSKSFELKVKILELNHEGKWRPVHIKQNEMVKTGGIYELKQGQSRQVSVSVVPVGKSSAIWYNGLLFNLEAHKIDKISMGCIIGTDISASSLDSYQEVDLARLKEKCHLLLQKRKQYLQTQIKQLSDENSSEEEKERCESLYNQLVALGDEQAAVDAPLENSHLPGSTIQWNPDAGMEKHVPVMFLELDDELNESSECAESDADSSDNDESSYGSRKKIKCYKTCGDECFLKNESKNASFICLKIVGWNDSNQVEMVDSNQLGEDLNDSDGSSLKAVARWDSTEHASFDLNKETPLDRLVYLTVKINLKLKLINAESVLGASKPDKYVDLILRKRICVSIYSSSNSNPKLISINRIKGFLGSSTSLNKIKQKTGFGASEINATGITYRLVSNVPKLMSEIENRESLAIKAAISVTENLTSYGDKSNKMADDGSYHFEHYAKTIEAVESILKRDRIQQQLELKKAILNLKKNGHSANGEDSNSMKTTFSVPNLLKRVIILN
ncbi:kinesin KIF13A [Brachionus plicatilis]|uniref:Kinesin KIF13A n=1 Tax=Brachionus plicatilis TaxID=10195 RepID=A0A3M7PAB7_BRAPC|nr:kinesin KIF13A [Brachionus plicatilis]